MEKKINFFEALHSQKLSGVAYKNMVYKKRILAHLANMGNCTIADLSKELAISIPKTNELVNELLDDAIITDDGKTEAGVGRKANMYGLEANSAFFVGVEVSSYHINIGLMNFKREMVSTREHIDYQLDNTEKSLNALCQTLRHFIDSCEVAKEQILGIGVNLSGRINNKTGYSFSYFNFHEDPLSKIIEQEIGIPTYLENDSRAMAYGEFSSGIVNGERHVLFVNIDHGIGLGIMINGELYYGKSGFAGEFGHIPVFDNEIICRCGKKGCLETEASGIALRSNFITRLNAGATSIVGKKHKDVSAITLADIVEAAKNDDTLAIELIDEVGEKLGRGMATLINLFNPELVILGGILANTGEYLSLPMKNAINKYSLSLVNNDTRIKTSKLGEKAGLMGACLILRDRLLAITS
ncbi:ROK family transcriptional regulator [Parapedobacter deserti]|uniref:ROK family transcriptional regulator n=1 Tax=Parapedobacter deserti TaxID=1912957 RepID=A0ABV7JHA1_9SPHI